eukprot:TRINITY_DN3876_c0_g1_i1.p1 TRINITY_DN3876_c0_g1~~TRINITY_DN3876_c0_g1_i1.p1  ORF type:complete len:497 (+),score=74.25 TRINITY_DN3876_c0_g1_i1:52-1491(+)
MIDAAKGMTYLHNSMPVIIHRDLKSHNLLVDRNFDTKVTDFGLAKSLNSTEDTVMTFCGTMPWTAPEIFAGSGYTTKADVYSYGVVLWELITREEPYKGMHKPQIIVGVSKEGLRPQIPVSCPSELAELMQECWAEDPHTRPLFSEILERLSQMAPPAPACVLGGGPVVAGGLSPNALTQIFKEGMQEDVELTHTWQIMTEDLTFLEEVGRGASSRVFKGKYRGQEVAIKLLNESIDGKHLQEFKKELEIMIQLRCPKVVFFYGAVIRPHLCLVTEFMEKGSLYDIMNDKKVKFGWALVFKLATEAALAVNALHQWKPAIVHRDLKSPNLLVDKRLNIKVADFGLARFTTLNNASSLAKFRGTYAYAAPETFYGTKYSTKSDVYSFGIILWELVMRNMHGSHHRPYSEYSWLKFDFQIIIQTSKKGLRPTLPSECPEPLKQLIIESWDEDPAKRPEFVDILQRLEELTNLYQKERQKNK